MAKQLGKWVLALDGSSLPDKDLIGGKAWSIANMINLGLKVPPSIVISTEACVHYFDTGSWPENLDQEITEGISWLEQQTQRQFGASTHPLLVSVRSGATISMPGMMDTILNLGMNDQTERALAEESSDSLFAKDTHRRFIELYADIVLKALFDPLDKNLQAADWRAEIEQACGNTVQSDVREQLTSAVRAVFESWNTRRAKRYRKHHGIPDNLGTAVTIQAMVYGNLDQHSGTGVLFTRNPLTGENTPYGEYLVNAQGEDVVSGKYTPEPLSAMQASEPQAYQQLLDAAKILEQENNDVQDIEFTVEKGILYLLQSRSAKRSPAAAAKIAVDMVSEGSITIQQALQRITVDQIRTLLSPRLATNADDNAVILAKGEAASPGVGIGTVVTDADEAERLSEAGNQVVLIRQTTSPDDVHGMICSSAIATEQGGSTSHAAVVSRALGRPCVVGCGEGKLLSLAGDKVTIDGSQGKIYAGELPVVTPNETEDETLRHLLNWATEFSPLKVTSENNADDETICLDSIEGVEEPDKLLEIIRNIKDAKAIALNTSMEPSAVSAAINNDIETIITTPTLPVLLSAAHHSFKEKPQPFKESSQQPGDNTA